MDLARVKARKFDSILESHLFSNNIPTSVYTSLVEISENRDKYSERKEIYPTDIYVKKMDDYEIIKYVDSYNVYDKAGAYAIQSPFAMYIEKMVGDYYSVVGLPINRVYDILKQKELL